MRVNQEKVEEKNGRWRGFFQAEYQNMFSEDRRRKIRPWFPF